MTTLEPPGGDDDREMLAVENLHVTFALRGGGLGSGKTTVTAVDGVSFSVARRETLGIVGESGCGKSTMANAIVRLVPFTGRIRLEGTDVTDLRGDALVRFRRRVQLVFQDPYASLNPRLSVRRLVGEPVQFAGRARGEKLSNDAIAARVVELLGLVGLAPDAADATPTSSTAVSANASVWPAPCRWDRTSSSPTSRCRRSTSRCRPRSSTCSSTCRNGSV